MGVDDSDFGVVFGAVAVEVVIHLLREVREGVHVLLVLVLQKIELELGLVVVRARTVRLQPSVLDVLVKQLRTVAFHAHLAIQRRAALPHSFG